MEGKKINDIKLGLIGGHNEAYVHPTLTLGKEMESENISCLQTVLEDTYGALIYTLKSPSKMIWVPELVFITAEAAVIHSQQIPHTHNYYFLVDTLQED